MKMTMITSWLVAMVIVISVIGEGEGVTMDKMAKGIENIENIQIYHVTPDHIRQRRSTDGHPTELHFDMHHSDNKVTKLRLRRSVDRKGEKTGMMRVYRIRDERLYEIPDSETTGANSDGHSVDIGFFVDENSASLFRIRSSRKRIKAYDLEGTVIMNNREYIVSPNNEYLAINESSRAHRLCKLIRHLDYGLDALEDETITRSRSRFQTSRRSPFRQFPWYARQYRSGRKKRQSEVNQNFVEVVFYCDFSCYSQFERHTTNQRRGNETVYGVIRDHFTFIAKAMNIRYESITNVVPDQQILISAQNLVVLDRADLSEFTEANQAGGLVDARDTIIAFRSYIRGGNGVPRADHWMLFTAYDLAVNGNSNTIGIAYLNRICSDASVSVIEEFFSETTAQIAAHELGHIMGADHDSSYGQCSDNDYNVMAGIAFFPEDGAKVENPWKFSQCSAQIITDFISGPNGACLKNRPSRLVTSPEEAGQMFNADAQCQLSQGPQSFFCRWCQKGRCIRDNNAPRINQGNTCPQGDDPFYGCTQRSCNDTEARYTFCCKTCGVNVRSVKPPPPPRPLPAVPPIPLQTRAPAIESINQIVALPPAPPPPPSPPRRNQRPQQHPLRRPVVHRIQKPRPTTTTPAPTRRQPVMHPWWRIPAPPPPPQDQRPLHAKRETLHGTATLTCADV